MEIRTEIILQDYRDAGQPVNGCTAAPPGGQPMVRPLGSVCSQPAPLRSQSHLSTLRSLRHNSFQLRQQLLDAIFLLQCGQPVFHIDYPCPASPSPSPRQTLCAQNCCRTERRLIRHLQRLQSFSEGGALQLSREDFAQWFAARAKGTLPLPFGDSGFEIMRSLFPTLTVLARIHQRQP